MHNTLAIIDNLVEILPEVGKTVCRRTNILKYLLQRVKPKKFDAVKLYASELLSILLQSSPHSDAIDSKESLQIQLCNLKLSDKEDVIDGMVIFEGSCYSVNDVSLPLLFLRTHFCSRSLHIGRRK